jgi:hypothetical protein
LEIDFILGVRKHINIIKLQMDEGSLFLPARALVINGEIFSGKTLTRLGNFTQYTYTRLPVFTGKWRVRELGFLSPFPSPAGERGQNVGRKFSDLACRNLTRITIP